LDFALVGHLDSALVFENTALMGLVDMAFVFVVDTAFVVVDTAFVVDIAALVVDIAALVVDIVPLVVDIAPLVVDIGLSVVGIALLVEVVSDHTPMSVVVGLRIVHPFYE